MNPVEIIPYRIQQEGGMYALLLGTQLIGQFTSEQPAYMVAKGLLDRKHAERVLRSVKYSAENNTIEDTP